MFLLRSCRNGNVGPCALLHRIKNFRQCGLVRDDAQRSIPKRDLKWRSRGIHNLHRFPARGVCSCDKGCPLRWSVRHSRVIGCASSAHHLDHYGAAGREYLVGPRTFEVDHQPRHGWFGLVESHPNALNLAAIHRLAAQLVAGKGIRKIHHQAIGTGEHLRLRHNAFAGLDLDLDRISAVQHLDGTH